MIEKKNLVIPKLGKLAEPFLQSQSIPKSENIRAFKSSAKEISTKMDELESVFRKIRQPNSSSRLQAMLEKDEQHISATSTSDLSSSNTALKKNLNTTSSSNINAKDKASIGLSIRDLSIVDPVEDADAIAEGEVHVVHTEPPVLLDEKEAAENPLKVEFCLFFIFFFF